MNLTLCTKCKIAPGANCRAQLFFGLVSAIFIVLFLSISVKVKATTAIYVANADSQEIAVLQLNPDSGEFSLLQRYSVKGAVMPMALSPDKRSLYAAIRSEPYRLLTLGIDPDSGRLSPKAMTPMVDSMANISVDTTGRYLFAASYGGNKISVHTLDDAGVPQLLLRVVGTGKHPHQITADMRNRFVYVSLLGDDQLDFFRFASLVSQTSRTPDIKTAIHLPSGAGPRHFVTSADNRYWYVMGELDARVHVLKRNPITGKSQLLESHALMAQEANTKPWAADIHLTPDGHFLYASERSRSELYAFRINQKNGRLTPVGNWKTELQPRAFRISPDGRYLVVAGQLSNHISIYSINANTGGIELIQKMMVGLNPSGVAIVSMP